MSTSGRIIRNTGYLYAKMAITVFLSLYATRLILNSLGASDFGIYNVVGGAVALLGFINASLAAATVRFMSFSEGLGDKGRSKSVFNNSIVIHLLIAVFIALALTFCGFFFFDGVLNIPLDRMEVAKMVYYALIMSTIFSVLSVPFEALVNAHEDMKFYAVLGIIESVLRLCIAYICVYTTFDKLLIYSFLSTLLPLLSLVTLSIYCMNNYSECKINPKKYFEKSLFMDMLKFAGWKFVGCTSNYIAGYGANILLNHFHGTIVSAAQGISTQINGYISNFSNNIIKAVNPVIVKKEGSNNRSEMYNVTFSAAKISTLLYSFFAVPVMVECPYILKVWLINVPPYTVCFCTIVLVIVMVDQITNPISTSIAAIGKIKRINIIESTIMFVGVGILFVCFYFGFSPLFFIIINFIECFLRDLYYVKFAHKNCDLPLKEYIKETVARTVGIIPIVLISTIVVSNLFEEGLFRLVIVFLTSAIIHVLCLFLFGFSIRERVIVKNIGIIIKEKIRK